MSRSIIRGEYEGLKGLWPTVSDTDKTGIVMRLEGLSRRTDDADADLRADIARSIAEIKRTLHAGPR